MVQDGIVKHSPGLGLPGHTAVTHQLHSPPQSSLVGTDTPL